MVREIVGRCDFGHVRFLHVAVVEKMGWVRLGSSLVRSKNLIRMGKFRPSKVRLGFTRYVNSLVRTVSSVNTSPALQPRTIKGDVESLKCLFKVERNNEFFVIRVRASLALD